MHHLSPAQELPVVKIVARNYATESDNRIHSDEVAAQYGFAGGLVPGVGLYAYMTRPIVAALGRSWLEGGALAAKFLHPVYDGEIVSVRGKVTGTDPLTIGLELFNSAATLCAVAQARLAHARPPPDPAAYPEQPLPDATRRLPPEIAALPAGLRLGSRATRLAATEMGLFLRDMNDPSSLYRGPEAACHPAFYAAEANHILMDNVALGPWIHTASEVQHYSVPQTGGMLGLRGSVAESYIRRGHQFAVLDLAMFGADARAIARIRHTAIIRLREPS